MKIGRALQIARVNHYIQHCGFVGAMPTHPPAGNVRNKIQ